MKFAALSLLSMLATTGAFAPSFGIRPSTSLDARKPFITGNWKLNPQTRDEAIALAGEIAAAIGPDTPDVDVALFVPYVFIESAMEAVDGKMFIGAEVCSVISEMLSGVHTITRAVFVLQRILFVEISKLTVLVL
jgi:hypothetical protein